jgi:hypothetical protein
MLSTTIVPTREVFESLINVVHTDTVASSIVNTSTDRVIGDPMLGHDIFHSIANNVIKKALLILPGLAEELIVQYKIDIQNPAGFNYNGERLAMIAQEFIKAFSIETNDGSRYLTCDTNDLPSHNNWPKLSRLLAMDLRTSLSLAHFDFGIDYHYQTIDLFLDPIVLNSIIDAMLKGSCYCSEIISRIYDLYCEQDPNYKCLLFINLQRLFRGSIDTTKYLELASIESSGRDHHEVITEYLSNSINFLLSNVEVRKVLANSGKLYDVYSKGDLIEFSLITDIVTYYSTLKKSNSLLILEHQFQRASDMSMDDYLSGTSAFAFVLEEVYMDNFDLSSMAYVDNRLRITLDQQLSLLENDVIKYQSYNIAIHVHNIEDFVARSGNHLVTKDLRGLYAYKLKPITDQIDFCMKFFEIMGMSDEELTVLYDQLERLKQELRTYKLTPPLRIISDQLAKYYGYCDL